MATQERLQEVLDCFIDFYDKSSDSNFTKLVDCIIADPVEDLEQPLEEIEEVVDFSKCIENGDTEALQKYWGSIFAMPMVQNGIEKICIGNRKGSNSFYILKYALLCSLSNISNVQITTTSLGANITFSVSVPSGSQISETVIKNKYLRLANIIIANYKPVGMKVAISDITIIRT